MNLEEVIQPLNVNVGDVESPGVRITKRVIQGDSESESTLEVYGDALTFENVDTAISAFVKDV